MHINYESGGSECTFCPRDCELCGHPQQRALDWQDGQPTAPGWYWVRSSYSKMANIIRIMENGDVLLSASDLIQTLDDVFGLEDGIADQFAGPIPEPEP